MKLDYGCGNGGFQEIDYDKARLFSWLVENGGKDTYGIDINPLRIETARTKIKNGTKFEVMDGRKLEFPDNYFDTIHQFGVLHHMPNYEDGVAELYRVLKPKGTLTMIESVDNDLPFRICRKVFNKWNDDEISNYFTTDVLDNILKIYFKIEDRKYNWRFLLSDFLREYNLEPEVSLKFNRAMSRFFNVIGLGKDTCCHYMVKVVKE